MSYTFTRHAFASQHSLDCNRALRYVHTRLPMSKSGATVHEPSRQLEDVDVTTWASLLPGCHHLQPKRLQVSYIAVTCRCLVTSIIWCIPKSASTLWQIKTYTNINVLNPIIRKYPCLIAVYSLYKATMERVIAHYYHYSNYLLLYWWLKYEYHAW